MKRLLKAILALLSFRATPPLVIGFFLLLYVGIAFATEEALIALMEITRRSFVLTALLALLPLNCVSRTVTEIYRFLGRRRAMAGNTGEISAGLFDESVVLEDSPTDSRLSPVLDNLPGTASFVKLESRLSGAGYKARRTETSLAAWKGISHLSVRIFLLAGAFCLFTGMLISLTSRVSQRGTVVEGEPLPTPSGDGGIVERIQLENSPGPILARELKIVAASDSGGGKREFGVYPPSGYRGVFVYPRYLGIGLYFRFSAPELKAGYETHSVLAIYPPGKEAAVQIPDSPYQIVFSLAEADDGTDPYMTGKMTFLFKLLKGNEVLFTGKAPRGSEFVRDGYRISFPDARRIVITDFVRDYGVPLIWGALLLFVSAVTIWVPIRFFLPRREMLFISLPDGIRSFSRAEGRKRRHDGVFHEALDLLETERPEKRFFAGNLP